MFTINQGFDLNSPQFNFKRDYFESVAALKAADLNAFPDHFITNVAGVLYQLTKSNEDNETTGKWRKLELGSDVDLSGYALKSEAIKSISFKSQQSLVADNTNTLNWVNADGTSGSSIFPRASVVNGTDGLMSFSDKKKLDSLENYTLKKATDALLGGILTGYTNNGKNYKVELDDNGRAFVNVPWTDTTTDISKCAKKDEDNVFNGTNTFDGKTTFVDKVDVSADEGHNLMVANGSPNKLFASNGDFYTIEAISDDFINALS